MNIWINKVTNEVPFQDYADSFIFSITHETKGTIFSSLKDTWLDIGQRPISEIYEDLFIISLSVFAVDKRLSRWRTKDKWTRKIRISIPVLQLDKWEQTKSNWNYTLSFLTGDIWDINFRQSDARYGDSSKPSKHPIDISKSTAVSLFSGGLDSFCGAIELLNKGESVCLLGHNEYPKLKEKQESLLNLLRNNYPAQFVEFIGFTANSRAPKNQQDTVLKGTENTSRGRSLLFLCAAISLAGSIGSHIPVYIPENGFIGLNIPLTNSRKGTCSTRTTHPYFIRSFNEILKTVNIENEVINFFAYMTKREIVNRVKDMPLFSTGVDFTISCSHPCLPRWKRDGNHTYPKNCGYCYPCLIRRSSLLDIQDDSGLYSYDSIDLEFIRQHSSGNRINDLKAVISSVHKYIQSDDAELKRLIMCSGNLTSEEIELFLQVYKNTMNDLIQLLSKNQDMKEYIGLS